MKHTVTKTFTFDTGHRLSNYEGKCKRLHGHTYKLEITVGCNVLDPKGMVVDFGDLKEIFKSYVDEAFDHRTLLYAEDPLNQAIDSALPEGDDQIVWTSFNPTAENIGAAIYLIFESRLPRERNLQVVRVRLYETPTSFADVLERPFGDYSFSKNRTQLVNKKQEDEFDNSVNP